MKFIGIASYNAEIEVRAFDKGNIISDVASKINDHKLKLHSLNARVNKEHDLYLDLVVEIKNKEELNQIIDKIKKIDNVIDAYRIKG